GLTLTGTAGSYTLSFGATGLTPATAGITLSAGAASKLALSTPPSSSAQSGVAFTQQPVVQVQDASGNPVSQSGDVVTATIASGPAGATLANATATTGSTEERRVGGVASTGPAGTYTLSFAATGLAAVTSSAIALGAGTASQLALTTQPSSSAQSGLAFAQQPVVQVQDASGNPVSQSGDVVTATIASGPAGATLANATATTGTTGAASFGGLAISGAPGTYTLSFGATGLNPATSSAIALSAGAAVTLGFTVQPSSAAAGATISPAVQVTARDAQGNTATAFAGTVTLGIGINPAGGTLSGTTRAAPVNGVATFSNLSIDQPGTGYTLTADASGLAQATSDAFNITPGAATQLSFTVQPTNTAAFGTISPPVQVTASDAFGNVATTFTGQVAIAIGHNGGLLFPGTLTGTLSITAVAGVA